MRVVGQNVPSELFSAYCKSLKPSFQKWKNTFNSFKFNQRRFGVGPDIYYARKRSPFRIPHLQSKSLNCPSAAQLDVRAAFKRCTLAYSSAHKWVENLDVFGNGPESRHYWYVLAERYYLWYYNFFIYYTWQELFNGDPPAWCKNSAFSGSHVGYWPYWDPDENYQDVDDWTVGKYWDAFGGVQSESYLFLQKDNTYPTNRFSRFILNCHGNEPVYVDVYGIPFDVDMSKITWNNKPNMGPLIGTYLIPNNGTYFNIQTYKQGTYNLLTSSIWRTIAIRVNRPFVDPPFHNLAVFVCKSKVAMIDERTYLTP